MRIRMMRMTRMARRGVAMAGIAMGFLFAGRAPADVAAYRAKLESFGGLIDYYGLDGDFLDSVDGGNGFNSGFFGPLPNFDAGVGGAGTCAVFGGRTTYLRILRSIHEDFTILVWLKAHAPGAGNSSSQFHGGSGMLHADWPSAPNHDFGLALTGSVAGFGVGNGDVGTDQTIHSTTTLDGGEWTFVAAVRRIDGGAGKSEILLYVNGVLQQSQIEPYAGPLDSNPQITIGANVIDSRFFKGELDEIALLGTALNAATISDLNGKMKEGVAAYRNAVKATGGLVDYYDFEGTFDDTFDGGNGFNNPDNLPVETLTEPTFDAGLNDETEGAVFDGIDDYFPVERSIQDSFTILAWIMTAVPGPGDATSLFYQGSGLIYADVPALVNDFGTAITGPYFAFGLGNPDTTIHSTDQVTSGEWVQVAAVRKLRTDQGDSEMRIYVNGVLQETRVHKNPSPMNAPQLITVGGNTVNNLYYTGMIDEIAFFSKALDDGQIEDSYAALIGLSPCFTTDALDGFAPLRVAFDATCASVTEGTIVGYEWDFGDGGTATGVKVAHTFLAIGDFKVRLTVTGSSGKSNSTTRIVTTRFRSGDVSPWLSADIGGPEGPGGARMEGGCVLEYARGKDIGGINDQLHYVYQPVSGDATITVKITSLDFSAISGKAGLMIRETLDRNSAFVGLLLENTSDGIFSFIRRLQTRGIAQADAGEKFSLPVWLRLQRVGDDFFASQSADGAAWSPVGEARALAMAGDVYAGLAATGRDLGTAAYTLVTGCELALGGGTPTGKFIRGDCNGDGRVTGQVTDAVFLLNYNFLGGEAPPCSAACDINGDGAWTGQVTDAVYLLNYNFLGGTPPPAPFPGCGALTLDSDKALGCDTPLPAESCP